MMVLMKSYVVTWQFIITLPPCMDIATQFDAEYCVSFHFLDFPPCSEDEYTCENGQCIPANQRCNLLIDCYDESDESYCGK